jgi:hypothetical protein
MPVWFWIAASVLFAAGASAVTYALTRGPMERSSMRQALSNWVEHEVLIEEGAQIEDLVKTLSAFNMLDSRRSGEAAGCAASFLIVINR